MNADLGETGPLDEPESWLPRSGDEVVYRSETPLWLLDHAEEHFLMAEEYADRINRGSTWAIFTRWRLRGYEKHHRRMASIYWGQAAQFGSQGSARPPSNSADSGRNGQP